MAQKPNSASLVIVAAIAFVASYLVFFDTKLPVSKDTQLVRDKNKIPREKEKLIQKPPIEEDSRSASPEFSTETKAFSAPATEENTEGAEHGEPTSLGGNDAANVAKTAGAVDEVPPVAKVHEEVPPVAKVDEEVSSSGQSRIRAESPAPQKQMPKLYGPLPQPSVPSPWPKATVTNQAYVFYWYEMSADPKNAAEKAAYYKGKSSVDASIWTGKGKTWKDYSRDMSAYSPVVAIYVAIYSLRKLAVTRKILLLSTNPEAADDALLQWLGVEVRVVPLKTSICKEYPGIPERRWHNLGQFTKLTVYDQTDLEAALYIDADAVFVRSLDDDIERFARTKREMGVVPDRAKCVKGDFDYGSVYPSRSKTIKCQEDDWNCGLMFMRPSKTTYQKTLAMSQDPRHVFDKSCPPMTRNKCLLGEAPFLHVVPRELFNGKVFCVVHDYVCFAHKMSSCDGQLVKMLHWQGRRKPWKDWWNEETKKPNRDGVAGKSVLLWWQMYHELAAALVGRDRSRPLRPRGYHNSLEFF